LNDAAASELELVPGVGPALARRIVEVRRADGPFDDVAALDRVPGIGPALVARIAPWVRVARSRGSPVARSAGAAARP
ncbi:helix-hairpin-helix domain-containing protein, partial [Myxococcota bacterium]|nr:helix-hairpin-helix domain-containing protein [Myxococcota bacterium]